MTYSDSIPLPPRPLDAAGSALWAHAHETGEVRGCLEPLVILCEQADERAALRLGLTVDDWRSRVALRAIDQQITDGLERLGLRTVMPRRSTQADSWVTELARLRG
jgi:hypothetical protein